MGVLGILTAVSALSLGQVRYLVSNWSGDNVRVLSSSGSNLGTLNGAALNGPQASRFGPDGLLYVADELNNRILRYNASTGNLAGTFVASGLGGLNGPTGLSFDGAGNLLVASFNTNSILKYSSSGAFLGTLVSSGAGGLNGPDVGMTIGPDGKLYVPSFWNHQVLRFDAATGGSSESFVAPGSGGLTEPRTMLWRGNFMLLSSDSGDKVLRYNATSGAFVDTFVSAGSGGLDGASGMAWDENGNLLVTSWRNSRLLRYNGTTGAFMATVADASAGLNAPTWVTVVPEPVSAAFLGMGALALASRRRRAK